MIIMKKIAIWFFFQRSTGLFPPTSCQQRAYSITSLEPNRPSPPHTDALDTISVVSFASMAASNQNLDTKADMMSSLLSMLGTHDPDDMARTLLAMSSSPDSCAAMRQSGCVPLLIKLLHSQNYDNGKINWGARQRAGKCQNSFNCCSIRSFDFNYGFLMGPRNVTNIWYTYLYSGIYHDASLFMCVL